MPSGWSRVECEATVADYFAMLAEELRGHPFNKADHRRRLARLLKSRSEQSIEFKHCNITAIMIALGFPYISGYKPRGNYQQLLRAVTEECLRQDKELVHLASLDADFVPVAPAYDHILQALVDPPDRRRDAPPVAYAAAAHDRALARHVGINYLEREARNRELGRVGEEFVMNFERARLTAVNRETLASRVEHVARTRGDGEGFDILSFEESGADRLIEVKTTKYGVHTPFFVSRNEKAVSEINATVYHLYRVFGFRERGRLFTLRGALSKTCILEADSYRAHLA